MGIVLTEPMGNTKALKAFTLRPPNTGFHLSTHKIVLIENALNMQFENSVCSKCLQGFHKNLEAKIGFNV